MTTTDTAMQALVIEAMYKSLDEKKREELLRSALQTLLTVRDSWGNRMTPLQEAFNLAVQQAAREIVFESLKTEGPIRDGIRKVCHEALEKLVLEDTNVLATKLAQAIADAMKESR